MKSTWFHGQKLKGCENAIVLDNGDVLLVKTVERIPNGFDLLDNYTDWLETFGAGMVSEQIRATLKEVRKDNI